MPGAGPAVYCDSTATIGPDIIHYTLSDYFGSLDYNMFYVVPPGPEVLAISPQ